MDTLLFYWSAPFILFILFLFLSIRLGFFSSEKISGKIPFIFGSMLLLFASIWHSIINLSDYADWFVVGAYPVLEILHFIVFMSGLLLITIGLILFADFWQMRKEDIAHQEQKLSLLSNLQRDAREPYHLMELFNISLKEIVSHLDETVGAVFLVNRNQRQILLTASAGLSKKETALLEHYPLGQNIITQTIELGDPMISSIFQFIDSKNHKVDSRYQSTLILPLISGHEKIGAIVLLSEREQFFSRSEIRFLSPIAEWLAEKVKSTKLNRELTLSKKEKDKLFENNTELNQRLLSTSASLNSPDVITSFCRSLVGLLDSRSVHLFGIRNGSLQFFGGSEPLLDLSENYKTALLDALDKKKPLIINQEATSEEGRTFIAKSSLIIPTSSESGQDALLLVKESQAFAVNDTDLKNIEIYANLGRLSLRQQEIQKLNITRRKGLDKIIHLLRFESSITFENNPNYFVNHLVNSLPKKSIAVTFVKQQNTVFKAGDGHNIENTDLSQFEILSGEGFIGNMNASIDSVFIYGKNKIEEALKSFDDHNRIQFYNMFGERGLPSFLAVCPIFTLAGPVGCAVFFMFSVSEDERGEWQKLMTLASGLYSIRLTINQLREKQFEVVNIGSADSSQLKASVNRLNNHLSAIIGNAELIAVRDDLTGELRNHFQAIINETELAAQFLKESLGKYADSSLENLTDETIPETINDIINRTLSQSLISENLYLVGGSPREINTLLNEPKEIELEDEKIKTLFEETINRFASTVEEEDIISISTYALDQYFFLDISRHHKNFPPVENVASFGEYQIASEAARLRPADRFLDNIIDDNCFYSYDRLSNQPSYLSFKFPLKLESSQKSGEKKSLKILAIDDQTVILDLISAMCQTSGYQVQVADDSEKGLQMALSEHFDLILTDLAMPGLSGLEVAREIIKKRPQMPIILVTGWEVNLSREKLKESGISKVLYKPFRIEQLTELINSFLHSRSIS